MRVSVPLSALVNCPGAAVASLSDIFAGSPFARRGGVFRVRFKVTCCFREGFFRGEILSLRLEGFWV